MPDSPSRIPHGIDTSEPHSARIYDFWLGGKDHYPVDRAVGEQIRSALPAIGDMAVENRAFLKRAVRFLARERGVRQFLDVGTGLPTADNIHEVAQAAAPDSRVVYVDHDPLVLAHARALLTSTPEGRTAYVDADLRDPGTVLREASHTLDLSRPVALTLLGVLFHVPDESAYTIVRDLMAALAPGSYVILTHSTDVVTGPEMREAVRQWNEAASVPITLRAPAQIERFFEGLEPVDPGLVSLPLWRPDTPQVGTPREIDEFGGVAYKP